MMTHPAMGGAKGKHIVGRRVLTPKERAKVLDLGFLRPGREADRFIADIERLLGDIVTWQDVCRTSPPPAPKTKAIRELADATRHYLRVLDKTTTLVTDNLSDDFWGDWYPDFPGLFPLYSDPPPGSSMLPIGDLRQQLVWTLERLETDKRMRPKRGAPGSRMSRAFYLMAALLYERQFNPGEAVSGELCDFLRCVFRFVGVRLPRDDDRLRKLLLPL